MCRKNHRNTCHLQKQKRCRTDAPHILGEILSLDEVNILSCILCLKDLISWILNPLSLMSHCVHRPAGAVTNASDKSAQKNKQGFSGFRPWPLDLWQASATKRSTQCNTATHLRAVGKLGRKGAEDPGSPTKALRVIHPTPTGPHTLKVPPLPCGATGWQSSL